jgi:hypothetical protein
MLLYDLIHIDVKNRLNDGTIMLKDERDCGHWIMIQKMLGDCKVYKWIDEYIQDVQQSDLMLLEQSVYLELLIKV